MTGNVDAISVCVTCAGWFFFWSLTVGALEGSLPTSSLLATGSRRGGVPAPDVSVTK